MHRRKPASAKQRKAQLQLKRAVKRGDLHLQSTDTGDSRNRPKPTSRLVGSSASFGTHPASSHRLQSSSVTFSPDYLEATKIWASTVPLARPVALESAVLDSVMGSDVTQDRSGAEAIHLTCPTRPKWRYDMTKREVERNEEGLFNRWLAETDSLMVDWQGNSSFQKDHGLTAGNTVSEDVAIPRSPTYFERNIEVWRQLWRVSEISQIILVLLDSRCPLIHFPPSFSALVSDRKVILILTKVDISGPDRAEAWTTYLNKQFPSLRIVQVESYAKQESTGYQGRRRYQPHLPDRFRERLVNVLKDVHAEMLEPPARLRSNPVKLQKWKPVVKRHIDWEGALKAEGTRVGKVVGDPIIFKENDQEDDRIQEDNQEPDFLTIGLIGQPNVGKSSLLNALFNTHKVRASKTPGKTKHFQTLFWTHDVRLVDCPGMVMPNFVPIEMQILCGVVPVSRVSAIPSCIYYAANHLPLEKIFKLVHPSMTRPPVEDRRTWRDGTRPSSSHKEDPSWTAMDILIAFADKKGWITAKAGRPDVYRAGNAILRSLAEGRVSWAFWPPGTDASVVAQNVASGAGIWIPCVRYQGKDEESDCEISSENENQLDMEAESGSELSGTSTSQVFEDDGSASAGIVGFGRFSALSLDGDEYSDL